MSDGALQLLIAAAIALGVVIVYFVLIKDSLDVRQELLRNKGCEGIAAIIGGVESTRPGACQDSCAQDGFTSVGRLGCKNGQVCCVKTEPDPDVPFLMYRKVLTNADDTGGSFVTMSGLTRLKKGARYDFKLTLEERDLVDRCRIDVYTLKEFDGPLDEKNSALSGLFLDADPATPTGFVNCVQGKTWQGLSFPEKGKYALVINTYAGNEVLGQSLLTLLVE